MSGSESEHDSGARTTASASAMAGSQGRLSRAAQLARRRVPGPWPFPLGVVVLLALGFLMFGANTNSSAMALATVWLIAGVSALLLARDVGGRRGVVRVPIIPGLLFCGVLGVGLFQLLDASNNGLAHPMWTLVDATPRITLDMDVTRRELVKLVALAAAFCVGLVLGSSDRTTQLFFTMALAAGLLYGLWAFVEFFNNPGYVFDLKKTMHYDRLTGSFLSANSAALAFGIIAILAVAKIVRAVKEATSGSSSAIRAMERIARSSGLAVMAFLLAMTCAILTGSRAGIGILVACLMIFAAWEMGTGGEKARTRGAAGFVGALGFAVLVMVVVSGSVVSDRAADSLADASSGRFVILEAHWRAFQSAPMFGQGLGTFPVVNDLMQTSQNHYILAPVNAAHNVYLTWLEEVGLVGAGLMFVCLLTLVGRIVLGLDARMRMRTWLRAILVASLLIATHGFFDYGLQVPAIAWFWSVLLGVGYGLARTTPETGQVHRPSVTDSASG